MAENPVTLCFNPDDHPDATLKAFDEFVQVYELRYEAQHPDPPRVSIEAAIERWKITQQDPNAKPSIEQYDTIREEWRSKDRKAKFLGMFSSKRFYADWIAAVPVENERNPINWNQFKAKMREFYKPTENSTLTNFHFRQLSQNKEESFTSFCNRVDAEAKHCDFKCTSDNCTAESKVIRDQIIVGTTNDSIRQEALLKSWDLPTLRKEGMKMESAQKGGAELASGEEVRKIGKYSNKQKRRGNNEYKHRKTCFYCGESVSNIQSHRKNECSATNNKCNICSKVGHLASVCKSKNKPVRQINNERDQSQDSDGSIDQTDASANSAYNINIFRVKSNKPQPALKSKQHKDYKVQVMVNNSLTSVIADTGAKVSVCGTLQAKR